MKLFIVIILSTITSNCIAARFMDQDQYMDEEYRDMVEEGHNVNIKRAELMLKYLRSLFPTTTQTPTETTVSPQPTVESGDNDTIGYIICIILLCVYVLLAVVLCGPSMLEKCKNLGYRVFRA